MTTASRARRGRVLLIEDNPADVELTRSALEDVDAPIELHAVSSGEEALASLQDGGAMRDAMPHLILLDLNLNGLHGHDVLSALKREPATMSIPVVICSSSNAPHDITTSYERGANAYMTKSMRLVDLQQSIAALVQYWFGAVTLPHSSAP